MSQTLTEKPTRGLIRAEPRLPQIDLLEVPHNGGKLIVNYPAFGPNTQKVNVRHMMRRYTNSTDFRDITFRNPTTSESISAIHYIFENIIGESEGQGTFDGFSSINFGIGLIYTDKDGIYVNLGGNSIGTCMKESEKVNGIHLGENDFGFAPYDSFQEGTQDVDTFSRGGLARILEHTEGKVAEKLRDIASPKFYKNGVVAPFNSTNRVRNGVVYLESSHSGMRGSRLNVSLDFKSKNKGIAFGVLEE